MRSPSNARRETSVPRQQLVVEGEMHQLDGTVALQFTQYVSTVDVNGFMAEVELKCDLFDAVAFDQ